MNINNLDLLQCINCGGDNLFLNIKEQDRKIVRNGTINCQCDNSFSIEDSIPRFLENWKSLTDTQKKFEYQWDKWGKEEIIFGRTKEESKNYLLKSLGFGLNEFFFKGKTVLDAGCGHGRFVEIFAEMDTKLSVGMDLGEGIEIAKWRNREQKNTLLVQGNILNTPFKPETFDYIWCNGVIHHTPNPKRAVKSLCKVLKKGGYINLWVYPKGGYSWEVSQKIIRFITTKLPPTILYPLCYLAVPLLYIVPTYSNTNPRKNTWKHCAQVIYDWYSPKFQSHHSNVEIVGWLTEFGCVETDILSPPVTVVGRKK